MTTIDQLDFVKRVVSIGSFSRANFLVKRQGNEVCVHYELDVILNADIYDALCDFEINKIIQNIDEHFEQLKKNSEKT